MIRMCTEIAAKVRDMKKEEGTNEQYAGYKKEGEFEDDCRRRCSLGR